MAYKYYNPHPFGKDDRKAVERLMSQMREQA